MKKLTILLTALLTLGLFVTLMKLPALNADEQTDRQKATQLQKDGNTKEAYDIFSRLATDPKSMPDQVSYDFRNSLDCLRKLGRIDEIDAFREKAISVHPQNWHLLYRAAQSYMDDDQHYGYIIDGEFHRGNKRGGSRYVSSVARDRVRALQLMLQAMPLLKTENNRIYVAYFYDSLSTMLNGPLPVYLLQQLTDITVLPDYEEYDNYGYGYRGYRNYSNSSTGAPVDEKGEPIYYSLPTDWQSARNDGERWRWAMAQVVKENPVRATEMSLRHADFLYSQFGEQTLAYLGRFGGDDENAAETGPYALPTLTDGETIAKLANGIKRITLPEEFNFIRIYQSVVNAVVNGKEGPWETHAAYTLAQMYENRRQYDSAAKYWQLAGEPDRVKQIIGNWGRLDYTVNQPAASETTVDYIFRNGNEVTLTADIIDISTLVSDVKEYLRSSPKQLDWNKMQIDGLGSRLIEGDQKKYLSRRVATWSEKLSPRDAHFDRRITIKTPLTDAGAYLITANMKDGNSTRVLLWISDTIIIKKPLDGAHYLYVADALSGAGVANSAMTFFGYRQRWIDDKNGRGHSEVDTRTFNATTDALGQLIVKNDDTFDNYQWLITTRREGRLAFLGYTGLWRSTRYDEQYNQQKIFGITDRPAYRPGQTMKYKFWANSAKYDQEGPSEYANQPMTVLIYNSKGEKVYSATLTADTYGGINGEYLLPEDATLGQYSAYIEDRGGNVSFRVEEYKKPEFEVKVDAPEKPVMLGEIIYPHISAKYYFGAPVTEATVKYKILRTSEQAVWYPLARWDWYYGRGYWWYSPDYPWYPGWHKWGCARPIASWHWGYRQQPQPEVIAEAEGKINADGKMELRIDTSVAQALYGKKDQRYEITAEVTDQSRRTIVGKGSILVAAQPFSVYLNVDRGYYRVGQPVQAQINALTLDQKPVTGTGLLRLLRISYPGGAAAKAVESEVERWAIDTDEQGQARQQLMADQPGQYRLSYLLRDDQGREVEGGYLFNISGEAGIGGSFRFNELELIPDKREYAPGEQVNLMVNANRDNATVLLFIRPVNGVYLPPKVLKLESRSVVEVIDVIKKDMPNFFVEAVTINNGQLFSEMHEIVVPPESRILKVEVTPSAGEFKPGAKATVKIRVTDSDGKPFQGAAVVTMYDKALEYISGGANVSDIKEFFWKWRRSHYPNGESSLRNGNPFRLNDEVWMNVLGMFGNDMLTDNTAVIPRATNGITPKVKAMAAKSLNLPHTVMPSESLAFEIRAQDGISPESPEAPAVRTNFADAAFWSGTLTTDANGEAEVEITMPENLTTWKTRVWALGNGTRVGEGSVEIITSKKFIIRLQAPRFFTQNDEVVLSAVVHNYLATAKKARIILDLQGGSLAPMNGKLAADGSYSYPPIVVDIPANGEKRVDWRVKAIQPGEAVVRMTGLTDEESDAMQMTFPVNVHGMLKMDSYSGVIRPQDEEGIVKISVPAERRPVESRLEIRYSPTLAGAMIDAIPYLMEYPYGCTEQTLNRFLPLVMTQNVLKNMGVKLSDIREKRSNLNAQEIGDDQARAAQWSHKSIEAVYDDATVAKMAQYGVNRLASMQCSDGGWGWFSGWGEQSYPHTTALVVHGLQLAQANGVSLNAGMLSMLQRGIEWLTRYQQREVTKLRNAPTETEPWKTSADALDAFIFMVLTNAGQKNDAMRDFLYRDRQNLPVYSMAMYGLALHYLKETAKRDMIIQNISQFLEQDEENQTAWLRLPDQYRWYWYGSEYEAQAYYLKLLSAVDPKGERASRMVKYLLNNRKHASYWNSTRDTAIVLEAFADFMKASGEDKPDMTVNVQIDGKTVKTVKINAENLFSFDNKVVLTGEEVTTGNHTITLRKQGTGPLYYNAYLTNFTLEDHITSAGLEVKVTRHYYKLIPAEKKIAVPGAHGEVVNTKVEKYQRIELKNMDQLKSGDLVEVEMTIESKNDYEYILIEDMKAAGFEPVQLQSGYSYNDLGAYMELRDDRVSFFARTLARGKHSLSYRLRAEIPGLFNALPTRVEAMYAPELKGNSEEIKLGIND